jgi:hypothetical protein
MTVTALRVAFFNGLVAAESFGVGIAVVADEP